MPEHIDWSSSSLGLMAWNAGTSKRGSAFSYILIIKGL